MLVLVVLDIGVTVAAVSAVIFTEVRFENLSLLVYVFKLLVWILALQFMQDLAVSTAEKPGDVRKRVEITLFQSLVFFQVVVGLVPLVVFFLATTLPDLYRWWQAILAIVSVLINLILLIVLAY